jgi:hypothetical protein
MFLAKKIIYLRNYHQAVNDVIECYHNLNYIFYSISFYCVPGIFNYFYSFHKIQVLHTFLLGVSYVITMLTNTIKNICQSFLCLPCRKIFGKNITFYCG